MKGRLVGVSLGLLLALLHAMVGSWLIGPFGLVRIMILR